MTTTEVRPEIYDTQEYTERFESLECDMPWDRQIQFTRTPVWVQEGVINVDLLDVDKAEPAEAPTVLNLHLLTRVRDHIRAHPEQHDQFYWVRKSECGTTGCIAGWAVLLNGDALEPGKHFSGEHDVSTMDYALMDNRDTISHFAQQLLGLSYSQREQLFLSDNKEALEYLDDLIVRAGGQ